jgi:hypothetical protein
VKIISRQVTFSLMSFSLIEQFSAFAENVYFGENLSIRPFRFALVTQQSSNHGTLIDIPLC